MSYSYWRELKVIFREFSGLFSKQFHHGQGFIQALLSATVFSLRLSFLISAGGAGAVSPPTEYKL